MTDAERIAVRVGVCRQTVSAVLNGHYDKVSVSTRRAILRSAEELGYVPDLNAKAMSGRSVHTIGLIMPSMLSSLSPYLCHGISSEVKRRGYQCYIVSPSDAVEEQSSVREFCSRRFDGMIISSLFRRFDFDCCSIPAVVSGSRSDSAEISVDFGYGMLLALEHLYVHHGHRHLLFLTDWVEGNQSKYLAFQDFSLRHSAGIFGCIETRKTMDSQSSLLQAVRSGVTAIVATSDILAGNVLNLFMRHGIRVPEDVAITGYDGLLLSSSASLQLSSVVHPIRLLSRRCVELLFAKISGHASRHLSTPERIRPMFFKGMTCGCEGYQPSLRADAFLPENLYEESPGHSCFIRVSESAS